LKKKECEKHGITYIDIGYWWLFREKGSIQSKDILKDRIKRTLYERAPEKFPQFAHVTAAAIPRNPIQSSFNMEERKVKKQMEKRKSKK